jgi:hypothetical protein
MATDDALLVAMIVDHRRRLTELLAAQSPGEWDRPSLCAGWSVREVVAHIVMPLRYSTWRLLAMEGADAAHDEATTLVGGLGHFGHPVEAVVDDAAPVALVDALDRPGQMPRDAHPHRVAHAQTLEGLEQHLVVEAGVETHGELAYRTGPAQAGDEFLDEALGPALGVGRPLSQPRMEHLAGTGPGGEDRVIAADLGVAEASSLLCVPAQLADGGVDVDDQVPWSWSCT